MRKIWLKGVAFHVTAEQLEELKESKDFPGTSMKEDEAFALVCKWHPDQAPEGSKKGKKKD